MASSRAKDYLNYIQTPSPYRTVNTPSLLKTNHIMLRKETLAVCFVIHTKYKNTLCGQKVECVR